MSSVRPPSDYYEVDTNLIRALYNFLVGGDINLVRQYNELIEQSFSCNAVVSRRFPVETSKTMTPAKKKKNTLGTLDTVRVCEDVRHDFKTVILYKAVCGMCPWLVIENTKTKERYVRIPKPTAELVIRVIHDTDRTVAELHQCTGYVNENSTLVDPDQYREKSATEEKFEQERIVKRSPPFVKVVDAGVYVWPSSHLTRDGIESGPLLDLYRRFVDLRRITRLHTEMQRNAAVRRLVVSNDNSAAVRTAENIRKQVNADNGQTALGDLIDEDIDINDAPREAQRREVLDMQLCDDDPDIDPNMGDVWGAKYMAANGSFADAKSLLQMTSRRGKGQPAATAAAAAVLVDKDVKTKKLVHVQSPAVVVDLEKLRQSYLSDVDQFIYGSASSGAPAAPQKTSTHAIIESSERRSARLSIQESFSSFYESVYTIMNKAYETARATENSMKYKNTKKDNLLFLSQKSYITVKWEAFIKKFQLGTIAEAHTLGAIDDKERVQLMRNSLGLSIDEETVDRLASKIKEVDKKAAATATKGKKARPRADVDAGADTGAELETEIDTQQKQRRRKKLRTRAD